VPTIKAGEGKAGIVTACGEVSIRPSVDLFGILQSDGYAAYENVGGPKIVHACCWSHYPASRVIQS
jgi:hypothetical protein